MKITLYSLNGYHITQDDGHFSAWHPNTGVIASGQNKSEVEAAAMSAERPTECMFCLDDKYRCQVWQPH